MQQVCMVMTNSTLPYLNAAGLQAFKAAQLLLRTPRICADCSQQECCCTHDCQHYQRCCCDCGAARACQLQFRARCCL
jgi:hypothetical protein